MTDPIFDSIRRGHEEEIRHEIREGKLARFPDDVLNALSELNLSAGLTRDRSEEYVERLDILNERIRQLHDTTKLGVFYLKTIAWSFVFIVLGVSYMAWR